MILYVNTCLSFVLLIYGFDRLVDFLYSLIKLNLVEYCDNLYLFLQNVQTFLIILNHYHYEWLLSSILTLLFIWPNLYILFSEI